jgi:hypothetical protein
LNRYDESWSKQWFGAGLFAEGSEDVSVDVFKKLERRGEGRAASSFLASPRRRDRDVFIYRTECRIII